MTHSRDRPLKFKGMNKRKNEILKTKLWRKKL